MASCSLGLLIFLSAQASVSPKVAAYSLCSQNHFAELEQILYFLVSLHHYNDTSLEMALSIHYLTVILMIYLFTSHFRLLRLPHRTLGARLIEGPGQRIREVATSVMCLKTKLCFN